jgi:nucleoside-diphosphate-sugar epimerase
MKAVIVGGAGFIGSNLTDKLVNLGWDVVVIDNLSTGTVDNVNPKVKIHIMDISDNTLVDQMTSIMGNTDYVFHFAASARVQPSIVDPISFNTNNVNGTLNVLVAAKDAKVKRFIYSASSSAYGDTEIFPTPETHGTNPMSPYGLQKFIGEQYCTLFTQVYGLDTVSLRYFNVYGERMLDSGAYCTVIGVFGKLFREGKPLNITNDGGQERDFTYVGDVIEANYLAAIHTEPLQGDMFNVGNGDSYSVNEIADIFETEKVYGEKRYEPFKTLADNTKLRNKFGWEPKGNVIEWTKKYVKSL